MNLRTPRDIRPQRCHSDRESPSPVDKPELILFSGQVPYCQRERLEAIYRRFGVAK